MRGEDQRSGDLFSYVDLEAQVPGDHPLRLIRKIANDVLGSLLADFEAAYSHTGRPSVAPEKLLRALLLQTFFSIRSERQLLEQLNFNLLYRWFVGLSVDDPVWDVSTFCKNRDRLLEAEIAAKFLTGVVEHKRVSRLLSRDHFSVDGTLIDAWASMKSFRPKDEGDGHGDGGPGACNAARDYHGEKRRNDTHASRTDADARLYRKGRSKSAQLCFMGHALMENRNGLAVGAALTLATGLAEREAALAMLARLAPKAGATLGGDKAYDVYQFKKVLQESGVVAHMAMRREAGVLIPKPPDYAASQVCRERIEEIFGWVKVIAGQAKTKFRGHRRVAASFVLAIAGYNLIRLPKLLGAAP